VDADAVPAQRVGRIDRGDRQLDQAHDCQEGNGEPDVCARGRAQQQLRDAATISSIVAPSAGCVTASTVRPRSLAGSATVGSRATTAPELIKGRTSFATGARTRLRFRTLTSVAYMPGRALRHSNNLPHTILHAVREDLGLSRRAPSVCRRLTHELVAIRDVGEGFVG
jgi:hypothetical protein